MKRRVSRFWPLLLFVLCCSVLIANIYEREPRYERIPLTEWLERYCTCIQKQMANEYAASVPSRTANDIDSKHVQANMNKASEAVRHIGTNALPYLLSGISYRPSRVDALISTIAPTKYKWLSPWVKKGYRSSDLAVCGFEILSSNATSAIPDLLRLAGTDERSAYFATAALVRVGKDAVPSLIELLTNRLSSVKINTAHEIFLLGANAGPAIPVIVQNLSDPDAQVRAACAEALGRLRLAAEITVPSLINTLKDSNEFVRLRSAQALSEFGGRARSAMPALSAALCDHSLLVRLAATNATRRIDPTNYHIPEE